MKAVIFDLDGTAIPNIPNGMPSERLIAAIKAKQGSIKLCAATGRPITNAHAIIAALGLTNPCVISADTQVIDPISGEVLWEASIQTDDVKKILEICRPYHYEILIRDELIGEGTTAAGRGAIEGHVNVMYVMGCAVADGQAILAELEKLEDITAAGVLSWTQEGVDIHITHKQATKEHAVAELLRILELTKDEVIGVGDADNDVHLFRGVGHKVAMGNGTERLKSLADEVIGSVDDDGLAELIENL